MDRRSILAGTLAIPAVGLATGAMVSAAPVDDLPARFAAALSAHDLTAFAALFADDYVNHQVSAAAPPPPAGTRAKDATVAFFRGRVTALPDLRVSVEASVANADRFAASFVYEGTHEATYLGVAPTGKKLRFTSCDIFRVANGLIVEHWGMGDIAGVLAQLRA